MARIESDIKLGFYPTSNTTMQNFLSKYFGTEEARESEILICDPCCGEGEILRVLKEHFPKSTTYGIELDSVRGKVANEKCDVFVGSDALAFRKSKQSFDFLFLNPPYTESKDFNGKTIRAEAEFVKVWKDSVKIGGYMLLVVTQLPITTSPLPLHLLEGGFEVEEIFYDIDNDDFKRFGQYFILLKRTNLGRKLPREEMDSVADFVEKISLIKAREFRDLEARNFGFQKGSKKAKIIFSPMIQLEKWQILDLVNKNDKRVFEEKVKQSLSELPQTSIESPNDGQAIILLMAGLVENKIAERYLVRGECKKVQTTKSLEDNRVSTRDNYVGEMYVFDTEEKKFFKLS